MKAGVRSFLAGRSGWLAVGCACVPCIAVPVLRARQAAMGGWSVGCMAAGFIIALDRQTGCCYPTYEEKRRSSRCSQRRRHADYAIGRQQEGAKQGVRTGSAASEGGGAPPAAQRAAQPRTHRPVAQPRHRPARCLRRSPGPPL